MDVLMMNCKTTCNRTLCNDCVADGTCDMCGEGACRECILYKDGPDGVKYCEVCLGLGIYASMTMIAYIGCRFRGFKETYECSECFEIISVAAFDHVKGLHKDSSQKEVK